MVGKVNRRRPDDGRPPLALIEEAVHLLRVTPASTWATYYVGALPFGVGLLYFWADMSRGAYADQRCAPAALGLALLFLWMVVWQTLFIQRLRAQLTGQPAPAWTWRRALRVGTVLGALIPPAVLAAPVVKPIAFAFYQNLMYVADGNTIELRHVARRAGRLAFLWIMPGYLASWAIWVFGFFVFLNVTMLIWIIPFAAHTFLGIDSEFSRNTGWMYSSTVWAIAAVLSYLCVNPLTKAVYALRCFYGESRQTAADLRADLRSAIQSRSALTLALLLALMGLGGTLRAAPAPPAQPQSASAAQLDQAIQRTMQQPRYLWRLPRERSPAPEHKSWFSQFVDDLADWMRQTFKPLTDKWQQFMNWLRDLLRNRKDKEPSMDGGSYWMESLQGLALVLIIAIATAAVMLLLRWRKRRRSAQESVLTVEAPVAVPDIADENVRADQLPEEGWLGRARELLAAGEWRLAVRALHLATLSHLATRQLISIAQYKSDRDYERELARRARTATDLQAAFAQNRRLFESVWYGTRRAQTELVDQYTANLDAIRRTPL